jgi:hypothetical protein
MSSLPPALPSLRPHSRASCLPRLAVVLPLVLCRLSFSSRHRLPSGGASTRPPLVVPLFFSGAIASRPPPLFVMSPLVTPLPPIRQCLCLSYHLRLLSQPFRASCPAGCSVASHYADASWPSAPLTLVAPLPLVAPLSCLFSPPVAHSCKWPDAASSHDTKYLTTNHRLHAKPKCNSPR